MMDNIDTDAMLTEAEKVFKQLTDRGSEVAREIDRTQGQARILDVAHRAAQKKRDERLTKLREEGGQIAEVFGESAPAPQQPPAGTPPTQNPPVPQPRPDQAPQQPPAGTPPTHPLPTQNPPAQQGRNHANPRTWHWIAIVAALIGGVIGFIVGTVWEPLHAHVHAIQWLVTTLWVFGWIVVLAFVAGLVTDLIIEKVSGQPQQQQ